MVVADYMQSLMITHRDLEAIGYFYNEDTDKWKISDGAADYIYTGKKIIEFALPGTLKVICDEETWRTAPDKQKYFPLFQGEAYLQPAEHSALLNFISIDTNSPGSIRVDRKAGERPRRGSMSLVLASTCHAFRAQVYDGTGEPAGKLPGVAGGGKP